jgi:acetaldehyde dehydrogenase
MIASDMPTPCAILGSGNIGTDLLIKILRAKAELEPAVFAGIDPDSDGLARARRMGVETTHEGIRGLLDSPRFSDVEVVFDATSAKAHFGHSEILAREGKQVVDLTPAAVGPFVVPVVNMGAHADKPNLNLVSCGGQATIPIVHAVNRVSPVRYAEIVASISSRSAGPGTRANIDEFTVTTARGLEVVGGAARGKAIIVLNPADPPILMRNTVFCLSDETDEQAIADSIGQIVAEVQEYVPGYRLKQQVQFERVPPGSHSPAPAGGLRTSVYLEVEGAAHYLPAYAGNLDIMTSAARATGERLARKLTPA